MVYPLQMQPCSLCGHSIPATGSFRPQHRGRQQLALRSYSNNTSQGSSRSVLDAFFYGRAFAEVLNEKLGEVADDLLVRVSKLDAERQQASREFFDEVEKRAQSALSQTNTAGGSGQRQAVPPSRQLPAAGQSGAPQTFQMQQQPSPDLQEAVDELRAEVAATRAQITSFKASKPSYSATASSRAARR